MDIVFDPVKDASNKRKHKVFLSDAKDLDWDTMVVEEDIDIVYGEERYFGLSYGLTYLGDKIYAVVFTEINDAVCRIISLRRATNHEVQRYANS
ncbi:MULTISPECIES: BrnT family toxin [Yersinia]|uniref:BrnT family toxin n=1 Tax=Yersinia TaxID=629 RepID=UPI00119DCEB9|nr:MULTISPECIES: BrnT family toxin [Yersinia]